MSGKRELVTRLDAGVLPEHVPADDLLLSEGHKALTSTIFQVWLVQLDEKAFCGRILVLGENRHLDERKVWLRRVVEDEDLADEVLEHPS